MKFTIDKEIIGSEKNLSFNNEFIKDYEKDYYIFGNNIEIDKDLKRILYLSGKKIEVEIPEKYKKMIFNVGGNEKVKWQYILPEREYKLFCCSALESIKRALEGIDITYYEKYYKRCEKLLESLERMKINKKVYKFLLGNEVIGVNKDIIKSFCYDKEGFAKEIRYNHLKTITGRLIIEDGPEVLRLNKSLKRIIKSRYKNGKVVQFDYVSLEPRIALEVASHKIPNDIYGYINERVFKSKLDRDIAKKSILSILFGMGKENLSKSLNLDLVETRQIILKIKNFFNVFEISKSLYNEYTKNGYIKNYYGRVIYPSSDKPHKLYSNYIQSSAVTASLLGFFNILNFIQNKEIKPISIIHDNFILDFSEVNYHEEIVSKIKEVGSKIDKMKNKFYLMERKTH